MTDKPIVLCGLCGEPQDSKFALKRHKERAHGTGLFRHVPLPNDPAWYRGR